MNINTIKARKSVRTFNDKKITDDVLAKLSEFTKQNNNPFNVPVKFEILDREEHDLSSPVIVGAEKYVAAKYKKQEDAEVALGYAFEKFILYATSLGLGTVWLAATIDRKAFEKAMDVKEGEVMPAVTPIGYAADKRSIRESLMRKGMKSDDRLAFETIFFKNDFDTPLTEKDAGELADVLQMVRWSPSATNKQPWRLIVDGNKVHFYESKTKGYAKETTGDIQKVDLGIAICHFEIAAKEKGLNGTFTKNDPKINTPENTEYITTFEMEK